jgi:hypothetical protein
MVLRDLPGRIASTSRCGVIFVNFETFYELDLTVLYGAVIILIAGAADADRCGDRGDGIHRIQRGGYRGAAPVGQLDYVHHDRHISSIGHRSEPTVSRTDSSVRTGTHRRD